MFKAITWAFMCVMMPIDYVLWNLLMSWHSGYRTFKECIVDNHNHWRTLNS